MTIEMIQTRKASLPVSAGDAADGEEHERRHARRDPEGALPVERPDKLATSCRPVMPASASRVIDEFPSNSPYRTSRLATSPYSVPPVACVTGRLSPRSPHGHSRLSVYACELIRFRQRGNYFSAICQARNTHFDAAASWRAQSDLQSGDAVSASRIFATRVCRACRLASSAIGSRAAARWWCASWPGDTLHADRYRRRADLRNRVLR